MKKEIHPLCKTTEPTTENLGRIIGISYRHMSDFISRATREEGFPSFSVQYMAVLKNVEENGITVNHLAEKILITKQAVSKMVKDLEKNGYVTIKKNPNDSRSVLIYNTPLAEKMLKFVKKQNQRLVKEASAILGEKRMSDLVTDLHKIMGVIVALTIEK